MRNLILPIIITIWGAAIVLRGLVGGFGAGAYGFGQLAAFFLGVVMVIAGGRVLRRHFSASA